MSPGYRRPQQTASAGKGAKLTSNSKAYPGLVGFPTEKTSQQIHIELEKFSNSEHRPSARNENPVKTLGSATSFSKIEKARNTLHRLRKGFTLPEHLDFTHKPSVSDISPVGFLVFNANNKPIREYKEALIKLQTDVDATESFAKPEIKASRKQIIDIIEEELRKLEDAVNERLERWKSRCEAPASESQIPNTEMIKPGREFMIKGYILHSLNALPIPPLPSLDVCRRIGNDPNFKLRYTQMVNILENLQLARLDCIAVNQPTDELDQSLVALQEEWQLYLKGPPFT